MDAGELSKLVCMEMNKEATFHSSHTVMAHLEKFSKDDLIKRVKNDKWII